MVHSTKNEIISQLNVLIDKNHFLKFADLMMALNVVPPMQAIAVAALTQAYEESTLICAIDYCHSRYTRYFYRRMYT